MTQDNIETSNVKTTSKYSVPKNNRGLLTKGPHKSPGPTEYSPLKIANMHKEPKFKMPRASRDISFSKYNSLHSELVKKGLYWKKIKFLTFS